MELSCNTKRPIDRYEAVSGIQQPCFLKPGQPLQKKKKAPSFLGTADEDEDEKEQLLVNGFTSNHCAQKMSSTSASAQQQPSW